jgi:hypothetical protein
VMIETEGTKPWPKWGTALSLIAIVLATLAWFFVWASNEYHASGGVSASLGFLYLPEYARKERSVYSAIAESLRIRGLLCGVAAILLSIVAMIVCASSRPVFRVLSTLGLAVIVLPLLFFLIRLFR